MVDCKSAFKAGLIALLFWIVSIEAKPEHIDQATWEQVAPYLLPDDHPQKENLDKLFSQKRAIFSDSSLKKASFINHSPRKWTHLIVTCHEDVPGMIFKLYLDVQKYFKQVPEYVHWIRRIEGRNLVESIIQENGWEKTFKVPKKWIYVLPQKPSPPKEFIRKNFILVEEDVETVSSDENLATWKGAVITEELLLKFYTLVDQAGLSDAAKPENAYFCKDGRIAFVDTESHHHWPVRWEKLTRFLSEDTQDFWKQLIHN